MDVRWFALLCLAGCGRIAFDPLGGTGDGGPGSGSNGDGGGSSSDATNPLGAVAWWHLDEGSGTDAFDAVGASHGMLVFGASSVPKWSVTSGARPPGYAVQFVGDGDKVAIGTFPILANLPQLTISAWINPSTVMNDGNLRCVFSKSNGSAGWELLIGASSNGSINFRAYYGAAIAEHGSMANTINATVWSHVVATWTGGTASGSIRIYVNNSEVAYQISTGGGGTRPDDSAIPASINCTATTSLDGQIDEVIIFDRVLTLAETIDL